jgi:hypothetical protein
MTNPQSPFRLDFPDELTCFNINVEVDTAKEKERQIIFFKKFIVTLLRIGFEQSKGSIINYMTFLENFKINLDISEQIKEYKNEIKMFIQYIGHELISRNFYLFNNNFLTITKNIFCFRNNFFELSNREEYLIKNSQNLNEVLVEGLDEIPQHVVENIMEFLECYSVQLLEYSNYDQVPNEHRRALLRKYSMNSNFFNMIFQAPIIKVKNLLFRITNLQKSESDGFNEEPHFYPKFFGKIKRHLENYICLMRFTLKLLKIPQYSDIQLEILKFVNFQKIFSCSINISELHIFCAMVACEFIKIFIKNLKFEQYKGLVLEKFLILIIMLIHKYKTSNIFLPYLKFIRESINLQECTCEEFSFISLMREELICVRNCDKTKFQEIFSLCENFYSLNNNNHLEDIINNIKSNVKIIRKRNSYENFIYLKLLETYLNNNKLFNALIKDSEFNKLISNKVAKIIYLNDYKIHDKCNFQTNLEAKLVKTFFMIINKLNLQIKEYFKQLDWHLFENIDYTIENLLTKIENRLNIRSKSELEHLIAKHSIESYKYLIEYNSKNSQKIDLKRFLKEKLDESVLIDSIDEKLLTLHCLKAYLFNTKEMIFKWNKNPHLTYKEMKPFQLVEILTELSENLKFDKKEEKVLIEDLNYFFIQPYTSSYILKENVLNSDYPEKSIKDLVNYYSILIYQGNKSEHMHALSSWRLIETLLNQKQIKIKSSINQKDFDNSQQGQDGKFIYLGRLIHNKVYNNNNELLQKEAKACFKYSLREANSVFLKNLLKIRESYSIYNSLMESFDFLTFFENLENFGYNKTCIAAIESYVNRILIQNEKLSVSQFDQPKILQIYNRCYSSIEDYENVFKNYILDKSLSNLLDDPTKNNSNLELLITKKNFKIHFEKFFILADFYYLKIYLSRYKGNKDLKLCFKKNALRHLLTFLKILFEYLLSNDINKSEELQSCFEMQIVITIDKILYGKNNNFSLCKVYYELMEIAQSAFKFKNSNYAKGEASIKYYEDTETVRLIKSLFTSRLLNTSRNNLIHLKIRRIISRLFLITDLEQKILSDIINIYRNDNRQTKNVHLKSYLKQYCENFENKTRNTIELLSILKFYEYLNDSPEFEFYFLKYEDIIKKANKFQEFIILNFKLKIKNFALKENIIKDIESYLHMREVMDFLKTTLSSINNSKKEHKPVIYTIEGPDEKILYISSFLDFIVTLLSEEFTLDNINSRSLKFVTDQLSKSQTVIFYLAVICIRCSFKNKIFNNLPKLFNLIYKYHQVINYYKEELKHYSIFLINICKELEYLNEAKISHIQQQLIMSYFLEKESPIYTLGVKLLSIYSNTFIHENAYWLSSFLISDIQEMKNNNRCDINLLKKVAENRKIFGLQILSNLKNENKGIIDKYIAFQSALKLIPYLARGRDNGKITAELGKINKNILPKGIFILPEMKNLRKDILKKNSKGEKKNSNISLNDSHFLNVYNNRSMRLDISLAKINEENENEESSNNFNMQNLSKSTKKIMKSSSKINDSNFLEDEKDMYIEKIDLKFEVMSSKEKPVKITFISKAGKRHNFLMKCDHDDILKEVKAMELFMAVDTVFKHEGLDVNYNLGLRLFNLVPVSQCTIIIEWIENAKPIKDVIVPQYEKFGLNYMGFYAQAHESLKFYNETKPDSNVLYRYFLDQFPEPNQWFEAKQRYLLSTAAWSMAGYFLGLNDRHLQNIMIDNLGEIIHIDFGYLLRQGKRLTVPEIVEFRFTRNFRRALGIFEENGPFLFYCEQVLKVFTRNFSYLFPKLQTLVMDPNCSEESR